MTTLSHEKANRLKELGIVIPKDKADCNTLWDMLPFRIEADEFYFLDYKYTGDGILTFRLDYLRYPIDGSRAISIFETIQNTPGGITSNKFADPEQIGSMLIWLAKNGFLRKDG